MADAKITKNCLECKKEFTSWKCSERKFCNRKCYSQNLKARKPLRLGTKWIAKDTSKMGKNGGWNKNLKMLNISGENHYLWVGDRSLLKKYVGSEERRSTIYKCWRKEVKERDNFSCRIADNNCDGRIEVHHILGWVEHPKLRYKVNNGITLCHAHHPRARAEEKRLIPTFQELVAVSK